MTLTLQRVYTHSHKLILQQMMKAYISDIVLNVHLYFVQIHFEGKLGYFRGKLGILGES